METACSSTSRRGGREIYTIPYSLDSIDLHAEKGNVEFCARSTLVTVSVSNPMNASAPHLTKAHGFSAHRRK